MGIVDQAIAEVSSPSREALQHVIDVARRLAPDAEDGTSYGMPALRVAGRPYVSVVAAAKHLSLFPFSPAAIDAVRADLEGYSLSKGTVRFAAEQPIPDDVLEHLLRARLSEIAGPEEDVLAGHPT
ncbi:uncharacterized protein YdhG (YjbR/CyaY superfamily) [Georgenia soli]|uniref:Uncharacterized protein YdhG (YjbR/CyaY superfamily) n=1 Tax=Georgenia soli TaxID=638953 RepID=A0A2A9EPY9_9MICO|nr:DUF1801 domain-containing protein [Georgenia soli]PFG41034.1 uncharacterized protein YdhG (YjbR/CyaY superfamily) [Georgenia soli]